jgi:hypothetical protein
VTACSQEAKYGRGRVQYFLATPVLHTRDRTQTPESEEAAWKTIRPAALEAGVLSIKTEEENCNA